MLKREFQNNQNYAKVGVKDETEDPSGELGLVGCKKSEKQLILLPSNYLRQLLWRYDNKHWKIQRRNLVENQKKGIFPFESKNTRRPCFKLLSIFPPPPSLSHSKAETTFSQLSNAKSLQNICCNCFSVESPLLHFFFSDFSLVGEVRPPTCELSLEYWKVGGGGRLLWLESGIQPISFLFSSFSR